MEKRQDKLREVAFFEQYAGSEEEYNVFTNESNHRLLDACIRFAGFRPGARIADFGCGSGIFTSMLKASGFSPIGVDLSSALIARARGRYPEIEFIEGDVEALPLADESFDGALLSGIVHHLPDPTRCAREVGRILKVGAAFVAFDPNRLNPFMYLYRDRSSPFYSSKGVTENERPVLPREVRRVFDQAGFDVSLDYLSGLHYRYVASPAARVILPAYNVVDTLLSWLRPLKPFYAFVLTKGVKRAAVPYASFSTSPGS
jgi:ubiquinone/menaquinone biosynthesis C-methylase UbiE